MHWLSFDLRCESGTCSSCDMGTSDLPEIYAQARGHSQSASAYISGKSFVSMLQLICSTWVIPGDSPASVGKLQEYFASVFIWDHVNFNCG